MLRAQHAIRAKTPTEVRALLPSSLHPTPTASPKPCHRIKGWLLDADRHPVPVRTSSHRNLPHLLQCHDLHPHQVSCFVECQHLQNDQSYLCPDQQPQFQDELQQYRRKCTAAPATPTPPTPPATPPTPAPGRHMSSGEIAGIVIGIVGVVMAIVAGAVGGAATKAKPAKKT